MISTIPVLTKISMRIFFERFPRFPSESIVWIVVKIEGTILGGSKGRIFIDVALEPNIEVRL